MSKFKLFIFFLTVFGQIGLVMASEQFNEIPPGRIISPFNACKNVVIVSKNKYEENKDLWQKIETTCKIKIQVAQEASFTQITSLNEAPEYLGLAVKVAEKINHNLDKSILYAKCSIACFQGEAFCSDKKSGDDKKINCSDRRNEILNKLKNETRKMRMALALSKSEQSTILPSVQNILGLETDKLINSNLRDLEIGTPNPVGGNQLQPAELEHARQIIKRERTQIDLDYQQMLIDKKIKHTPELEVAWKSKMLMDNIDARETENRLKYRHLLFESSPILAVIEKPKKFAGGDVPVWSDQQMVDAFLKLVNNAESTKAIIQESLKNGKLEFNRSKGEALGEWLKGLVPGVKESNDLLYYMGMKNQVEAVLQENQSMCAAATTMSNRLSSKDLQNNAIVFVTSFAGGSVTKGVSRAAAGVFRIGRALTGTEAAGLTGLSIGSAYLGDSFRQLDTSIAEVKSGVRDSSDIETKRTNVKMNLAFAPTLATTSWELAAISATKNEVADRLIISKSMTASNKLRESVELNSTVNQIKKLIVEKTTEEWIDGYAYFTKDQLRRMSKLDKLSGDEKVALLNNLKNDSSFLSTPKSYQNMILMKLYDSSAWLNWIQTITEHGMSTKTVAYFKDSMDQMPTELKDQIMLKISENYDKKYNLKGTHPIFLIDEFPYEDPIKKLLTKTQKKELLQNVEAPKRIFDSIIPELTGSVKNLYDSLKSGEPTIKAYDYYLKMLRNKLNQTRPDYSAEDVLAAGQAIQKKMRELLKDPQFHDSSRLLGKRKPYVVIYGSFPNGRANFKNGSDLDMAVSYTKLATGAIDKTIPTLSFQGPHYLATWDMENAAMKVLKDRLKLESTYNPMEHTYITDEYMHSASLDKLSPVRLKISEDSIELEIDCNGRTNTFKF